MHILATAVLPALTPAALAAEVGCQKLRLVSCGVRDTLWIDHYAAGLYLPKGQSAQSVQDEVQDEKRPKAVQLKIINARYLPEDIPQKWRGALKSEMKHEPMVRVRQAYDRLSDGDVVTFSYLPGKGMTMQVNGRTVTRTPGDAVIDSILKAWAGKDPVTGKLHRLALQFPC